MSAFYIYNSAGSVGKCFWVERRGRVSSMFSYDADYLADDRSWNIDPSLSLVEGAQAAVGELPGALRDAAPDRWGRNLLLHRYNRENAAGGKRPRSLNEIDYLLGVSDVSRQGNLRFALEKGGEFWHPSNDVPKLIALPKLLAAADEYADNRSAAAMTYLLDAGSASLGGARPKASVADGEDLFIAKFPHRQDETDVIAWEWVALELASAAGIDTPAHRLVDIGDRKALLSLRFDRRKGERIGYISAMTALGKKDGERADYSEIAEKIRDISVSVGNDLKELFRRIVFSLLINNTDDHLKNHGFLTDGSGWRLSPVFDVNPDEEALASRATAVFGETERKASLSALMANADHFGLTKGAAETILAEVARAMDFYAERAAAAKIRKDEIVRFGRIFDAGKTAL
jgi:serine/threonine-protein kinase HipA